MNNFTVTLVISNNKTSGRNKYKVRYGDKGDNYDDNIGNLLKRRVELTGEITSTLRDVGILKHDIERLSTDITETGNHVFNYFDGLTLSQTSPGFDMSEVIVF